ncbi:hypothetical protein HL738_000841 [Campylobacter lari]|nr:hypothetical protein [Campylobacter lari]
MIFLIGGESHTGKTLLAQKLLEKYFYSYLSLDHLKMGLIKGMKDCPFKVYEDEKISEYLFPIIESIIQTCLENSQRLCWLCFYSVLISKNAINRVLIYFVTYL